MLSATSGYQRTDSESHPDWRHNLKDKLALHTDVGGEFFTQKWTVTLDDPAWQHLLSGVNLGAGVTEFTEYNGPCFAILPTQALPPTGSLRDLRPLGTTAIARCKPTNSVANLAVFLAELYSDGLPKLFGSTLWKDRTVSARNAGEEYLNVEFGWKPLVSDVMDIHRAVTHASTVLEQYERGSGSMTRRKYEFPIERTESRSFFRLDSGYLYPDDSALYDLAQPKADVYKWTRTWRRTWFSGAFTYHLPSDYRSRNALISNASKARTLLGLDLTPEVLWNAAPWSWAIDWFSNAGDVISNLSDWSTDGLVLIYGYVMEHSFVTDTYYLNNQHRLKSRSAIVSPVTASLETKRRVKATPFGFAVDWHGLSPRQLAISAALGLTHH